MNDNILMFLFFISFECIHTNLYAFPKRFNLAYANNKYEVYTNVDYIFVIDIFVDNIFVIYKIEISHHLFFLCITAHFSQL